MVVVHAADSRVCDQDGAAVLSHLQGSQVRGVGVPGVGVLVLLTEAAHMVVSIHGHVGMGHTLHGLQFGGLAVGELSNVTD